LQRTLIIVKPHAVARGLVGEFLTRFERIRLNVVAIRVVRENAAFWERFYPSDEEWLRNVGGKTLDNCRQNNIDVVKQLGTDDAEAIGRKVKGWLVDHMSEGPSVAAVLQGNESLAKVRAVCGATLPNVAVPGTIRFEYSSDSPLLANIEQRPVYNLIHASDPGDKRDGAAAPEFEIGLVFPGV